MHPCMEECGAGGVILPCPRSAENQTVWSVALMMTSKYMELGSLLLGAGFSRKKDHPLLWIRSSLPSIKFEQLVMIPVGESREEMWPEGLLQERFCYPRWHLLSNNIRYDGWLLEAWQFKCLLILEYAGQDPGGALSWAQSQDGQLHCIKGADRCPRGQPTKAQHLPHHCRTHGNP